MDSDFGLILALIFFLIVIGGVVVFFVVLAKNSKQKQEESERYVQQLLMRIPDDKKALFLMQYNSTKKNPTTAVILALFLGGIGVHKFYMNKAGLGVLYLLFCWTYIPAIIAFIEAFTISGSVGDYNRQKANEIAMMFGGAAY
jgi:TM2 domain-containing membrane protein YozV